MAFDKLTKPSDGIGFWVFNMYLHFNFAKTITWCDQAPDNKERTTRLLSIHIVEREFDNNQVRRMVTFIVGPMKLMMGLSKN